MQVGYDLMMAFQAALHRYRGETCILFGPAPGWIVNDRMRSIEKQGQTFEVFQNILKELEIPYVELGEEIKDLQARVAFARGPTNVVRSPFRCRAGHNAHVLVSGRDEIVIAIRSGERKAN